MSFRDQIRAWLEQACPPSMRTPAPPAEDVWGGRRATFPSDDARLWFERCVERGYTAPTWPREYGGAGLSREDAAVLAEEMKRLGCRMPLKSFGLWMLGPAVLEYGNEAQKPQHIRAIVNGEEVSMRVWLGVAFIGLGLTVHQWQSLVALASPEREAG